MAGRWSRFEHPRSPGITAPTWRSSAAASPAAPPRTNWHRLGARVVLIEAARIGRGSTAASTALLMQEPDADFGDLAGRHGASGARQVWEASRLAVRGLIRTLKRLPGCAAGRDASVDLLHAARGAGGRAEEGTGGAASGRDCRRVADGGGTTANGWFRRSRRDPQPRQRAGRSVRRLYGFCSRGTAGRRTAARALEGARHPAAWRRRRDRYRSGAHLCAVGGHCDGLRHTGIQAAGRALQDVRHLRCRDAAPQSPGARGGRPARRHALGHRTPVSLRALDARPSPPLRRPRSAAQAEDDAGNDRPPHLGTAR